MEYGVPTPTPSPPSLLRPPPPSLTQALPAPTPPPPPTPVAFISTIIPAPAAVQIRLCAIEALTLMQNTISEDFDVLEAVMVCERMCLRAAVCRAIVGTHVSSERRWFCHTMLTHDHRAILSSPPPPLPIHPAFASMNVLQRNGVEKTSVDALMRRMHDSDAALPALSPLGLIELWYEGAMSAAGDADGVVTAPLSAGIMAAAGFGTAFGSRSEEDIPTPVGGPMSSVEEDSAWPEATPGPSGSLVGLATAGSGGSSRSLFGQGRPADRRGIQRPAVVSHSPVSNRDCVHPHPSSCTAPGPLALQCPTLPPWVCGVASAWC